METRRSGDPFPPFEEAFSWEDLHPTRPLEFRYHDLQRLDILQLFQHRRDLWERSRDLRDRWDQTTRPWDREEIMREYLAVHGRAAAVVRELARRDRWFIMRIMLAGEDEEELDDIFGRAFFMAAEERPNPFRDAERERIRQAAAQRAERIAEERRREHSALEEQRMREHPANIRRRRDAHEQGLRRARGNIIAVLGPERGEAFMQEMAGDHPAEDDGDDGEQPAPAGAGGLLPAPIRQHHEV
jgi:hypothetical protein